MQPSPKDKFVSYLDKQFAKSPMRQFGEENRAQRQANFESKFNNNLGSDSVSNESSLPAIAIGRTSLIGERPNESVSKLKPDDQGKYFEFNSVTKSEGNLGDKIEKGFKELKDRFESKVNSLAVSKDKFEVDGVVELGGGSPKKFEKKDFFKKDEIKRFVDIDPDKLEKIDTTSTPKVENHLDKNADALIEGLYGQSFKDKLNLLLDQRLDYASRTAAALPSTDSAVTFVKGLIEYNNASLGTTSDKDEAAKVIKDAIKVALLQNPDKISEILNALAGDPNVKLDQIPEFTNLVREAVINSVADKFMLSKIDYFNPTGVTGDVTKDEAEDNRKALVKALKEGQIGLTLTKAGTTTDILPGMNIIDSNGFTNFSALSSLELGPKLNILGEVNNLNSFKSDLYRGLRDGLVTPLKEVLKATSMAMSTGDTIKIFEEVVVNGIIPATTDTSLSTMQKLGLLAKIENALEEHGTVNATLKPKLEAIRKTLVEYSTPEGIAVGLEKDMLNEFIAQLPASINGVAVDKVQLLKDISDALEVSPVNKAIFDRLSLISAGVTDKTTRERLHDLLRASANIEIMREIAARNIASASDLDKHKQFMLALLHKFVISDDAKKASSDLLSYLYGKPAGENITSIDIDGNPELKEYINNLLGASKPVEAKLDLVSLGSDGKIYSRAHELLGSIRKGAEAGEWMEIRSKGDDEIKKYLVENFGLKEDSKQLDEALVRFKEVSGNTGVLNVEKLVEKALADEGTSYGRNYTNQERMLRYYVENGGKLEEIVKDFEKMSLTSFVNAVQKDANSKLGSEKGDAVTEKNRVLSIEEQRASILEGYEDLSGAKGIKGFFKRMVAAVPRIMKSVGFMALAFAGSVVPVIAGPIAIAMAVTRVVSIYKTVKNGIPMVKDMWNRGDTKMAWAMAAGVGVNVLINTFVPSPWGMGLSLIGETVGLDLFAMKGMKQEAQIVVKSMNEYDEAFKTYFNGLTRPEDKDKIEQIARSLNVPVTMNAGIVDVSATWDAVKIARDTARNEKNITLLREFSKVVESMGNMPDQVTKVRDANLKAKAIHEDTQRTLMAYSLASSATKLGFAMTRGAIAGWRDGEGGILGGVLGTVGIADYRTLLHIGHNNSDTGNESSGYTIDAKGVEQLHTKLESELDQFVTSHGHSASESSVLGLAHTSDGHTVAMIDTDGDPSTAEAFLPLDSHGNLDFSSVLTNIENVSGNTETVTGLEANQYTAVAGDSQWTMIEHVLEQRYPNAPQQEIWTLTANIINEATPHGVYQQLYDHRVDMSGGTVHIGDKLTMQDIAEMAPHQFARAEANISHSDTISSQPSHTTTTESLTFPEFDPSNVDGAIQFSNSEGFIAAGNLSFMSNFVGNATTQTGGGNIQDDTSTNTSNNTTSHFDWKEFILGKPRPVETTTQHSTPDQTGGGNVNNGQTASNTESQHYDTFTIKDSGLGHDAQIDESKVEQIIVHGKFEAMPDTIIDPSKVDVLDVSTRGVTYLDAHGDKVFVQNERGDIAFKFVGVDKTVNLSQGTENVLDILSKTTEAVAQTTGKVADAITRTDKSVEKIGVNVDRLMNGVNELGNDVTQIFDYDKNNPIKVIIDNGFAGDKDYFHNDDHFITPTGTYIDSNGQLAGSPFMFHGTPATVQLMSIKLDDGTWKSVPLQQISKVGEDYITYLDDKTNSAVTLSGNEVLGVGYTYDQTTNQILDPVQFDFNQAGVAQIEKVEQPWWDTSASTPAQP